MWQAWRCHLFGHVGLATSNLWAKCSGAEDEDLTRLSQFLFLKRNILRSQRPKLMVEMSKLFKFISLQEVFLSQKKKKVEYRRIPVTAKLYWWTPTVPSSVPARCGALLAAPELALSCWSSAASFSPLKHLQKSVPQPCVMNKEALPLFPWVLFPCCYTECVLLTKSVMDVGLPLCLCLPDKEGCTHTHTHRGKHANTHSCTPQTYTHRHP